MKFEVLPYRAGVQRQRTHESILLADNWDDYFKFETTFLLVYFDHEGQEHKIGSVKVGEFGMAEGQRIPNLPSEFEDLPQNKFFSLGQDDSYYEKLNELGPDIRNEILETLCDVAYNNDLIELAKEEEVFGASLLRYVSLSTVLSQYNRVAHGGVRLTNYEFSFSLPRRTEDVDPPKLTFEVEPSSNPPTNVHVLIGRNGVGKTFALNCMTRYAVEGERDGKFGKFEIPNNLFEINSNDIETLFSSIVSVTFSAFDPFEPVPIKRDQSGGIQYHYVGLKYQTRKEDGSLRPPKDSNDLAKDFANSFAAICSNVSMQERWLRAVRLLYTDPLFRRADVVSVLERYVEAALGFDVESAYDVAKKEARRIFGELSSGHKIVLLTITRLVETVSEKTLVLLDEPEAHLHPPVPIRLSQTPARCSVSL